MPAPNQFSIDIKFLDDSVLSQKLLIVNYHIRV